MRSRRVSMEDTLLRLLLEPKYKYKGMPVSALGIPALFPYKRQTIHNTLSRLRKKDCIVRVGEDSIMIRPNGRRFVADRAERLQLFKAPVSRISEKRLLVLFDIPEDRKAEREWFRWHLKEFGYEMIQRSVWLGPAPLPKAFVLYVTSIGLGSCIKTFAVHDKGTNL